MFSFFNKKDNGDEKKKENESKGFFSSLKETLSKTSKSLVSDIVSYANGKEEFDDLTLDDMEEMLIKADLGVSVSSYLIDNLRKQNIIKPSEIKSYLKDEFSQILDNAGDNKLRYDENELNIYLITGVNGVGKTTLIAKLANRFKNEGKKVLLAAGDTFRAAAVEQLQIWAQRINADIVFKHNADPSSVVYEAISKAKNENYDVLIIDTAGRLQNKYNLMEELNKIKNVIIKNAKDSLKESLLVLDASMGQNGINQAKMFFEVANLTGVALTKLDGSSKGAVIISIAKDYKLPLKLIGVGEKVDDIKNFDQNEFIESLFV